MANTQIRNNDILDGTISGAKISASAAIDSSKITPPGSSTQLIYNSSGAFAAATNAWANGSSGLQVGLSNFFGVPANSFSIVVTGGGEHWLTAGLLHLSRVSAGGASIDISVLNNTYIAYTANTPHAFLGGNVGINSTAPASLLSVGSGNEFQVNSSGDIIKIKSLTYAWPAAHASGVLTNNGSGTLTWAAAGSGGHTIQDEGTPQTARANLNFVGAGVTVTDDAGNNATVVTIPGGSGVTGSGTTGKISKWSSSSALTDSVLTESSGKIGIGHPSSISAYLHIGNGTTTVADTDAALFLQSGNGASSARDWKIHVEMPNGRLYVEDMGFNNGGGGVGKVMTFDYTSAGRVGIGNTAPAELLSVGTASALTVDASGTLATTGNISGAYLAVGGATMGSSSQRIKMPDASFIVWETSSAKIGAGSTNMVINAAFGASNAVLVNYGASGACGGGGFLVYDGSFSPIVKFRIDPAGVNSYINTNFGVLTNTPSHALHVVGAIKMVDGNQATNKIMLSDSAGVGSWGQYADRINAIGNSGATKTITWTNGLVQTITLDNNCTFSYAGAAAGQTITLFIKQDATGSRTVTWPTTSWPSGTAPTLTTTANKTDVITVFYDGTTYFGFTGGLNY